MATEFCPSGARGKIPGLKVWGSHVTSKLESCWTEAKLCSHLLIMFALKIPHLLASSTDFAIFIRTSFTMSYEETEHLKVILKTTNWEEQGQGKLSLLERERRERGGKIRILPPGPTGQAHK